MLKIVGDSSGQLFVENDGQKVAIITDEYFWKDFIDDLNNYKITMSKPLSANKVRDVVEYISKNIMDNIRSWELESVITDGITKCQNEYIENYCED